MPQNSERLTESLWRPEFVYPPDTKEYKIGFVDGCPGIYLRVETPYDRDRKSPLDFPDLETLLALKWGLESFSLSSEALSEISAGYLSIFSILAEKDSLQPEDLTVISDHYFWMTFHDNEFIYSGHRPQSYARGLIHAIAQRNALLKLMDGGRQDEVFPANLIHKEWELFEKIYMPDYWAREGEWERLKSTFLARREALILWHQTWLPEVLGQSMEVFRADGLAITRRAIERFFQNFLPIPWIGLEGIDKCGKDTQADILAQFLGDVLGWEVLPQNFPTDFKIGQLIRAALRGEVSFDNPTMQGLFQADRLDFRAMAEKITEGKACLVTKRYSASGMAYGAEDYASLLRYVIEHFSQGWADLTIMIDTSVDECMRRITGEPEMYEKRGRLAKGKANYLRLLDILPRFVRIDGMEPDGVTPRLPEAIFRDVVETIVTYMPNERLAPSHKEKTRSELDGWIKKNQGLFIV